MHFGNSSCGLTNLKENFLDRASKDVFGDKEGAEFHEKNISPAVLHRFGSITLWACVTVIGNMGEGRWIQLNTSNLWKQT